MFTDLRARTVAIQSLVKLTGRLTPILLLAAFAWLNLQPASATSSAVPARANGPTQNLSFDDRLACQTAVEEVYWQARIWPESNPGPKPALSEIASSDDLAAMVEQTLAHSVALEHYWHEPITGPMLQAELERMASATRDPALLQALYAALDYDPLLVAECLARPLLAERLVHDHLAADERFSGQELAAWWTTAQSDPDDAFAVLAFDYQLPTITVLPGDDSWLDTAAIPLGNIDGNVQGTAVWTGSEMVYFGNFHREAYRYNPATDSWQTTSTLGGPLGLRDTTAVWTGTYVVASNGCTANNHNCTTSLAWRYDPLADLWESIPNAPISRTDQSAVWTGAEMLVWGGCTYAQDICQVYSQLGARYNPDSNSWQTMSTAGAPLGRTYPNLVWTGTEMIVWGGQSGNVSGGGRYNPATNSWSSLSATNAPISAFSTAVWSGAEMIAWGGCTGVPSCNTPYNTGGRYDPATDTWTPTSASSAPAARFSHRALWIGDTMLIWGGDNGSSYLNSGGRYNPVTDSWTAVSGSSAPGPRRNQQMLWTGSVALIWGGTGAGNMRTGGRYNPLSDSWTPINTKDPNSIRTYHMTVWTGAEMIVWGGVGDGSASTGMNTGRKYDPATDSWSAITNSGAPPGAWDASAVWTGVEMIVWGGQSGSTVHDTGGRYNPVTNSWTAMAVSEGRTDNAHVWTGTEMIVWGGSTWSDIWSNTGARYNPATNSWSPMATAGAPSGRKNESGFIWTGAEMLVWGGFGPTGEVGSGGRYNPASNSWMAISAGNAPAARYGHAAVWTGSEMIVWGGATYSTNTYYDTGGRYNPATDAWSATSTINTPLPALFATAVWSGAEMIVWGGRCHQPGLLTCHTESYEGGRYDPQTDSWTPTTLDGVPEARVFHTAVWTGEAMIIWGGIGTWNGYRHTGGLYYPTAPENNAPTAVDDSYEVQQDELLTVAAPGVLTNDSDPDNDPLTAVLVSTTSNGDLTLNLDGSFSYMPEAGFVGTDEFTYRADDAQATSNLATVSIAVNEISNSAPTAVDDSYEVQQDELLIVVAPGVLANDSDPDGDPLTVMLAAGPGNGSVTVNVDGSFTYMPDSGFVGADTFTYTVDDGRGGSATATVTITIHTQKQFHMFLPIIQG
jgi:N-acetylneuraminic acid mutarotase